VRAEERTVKQRILIADDDEGVRQVLRQSLEESGYEVICVESGEKAIDCVREETTDLAIVDMVLPRLDGLEVLKQIVALRPELGVVMITGYASVETAIKAMKIGAVDYVVKPFRMDEVEMVVGRAPFAGRTPRSNASSRATMEFTTSSVRAPRCGRCSV
jgi:DNA-binding NtrC family response regulator